MSDGGPRRSSERPRVLGAIAAVAAVAASSSFDRRAGAADDRAPILRWTAPNTQVHSVRFGPHGELAIVAAYLYPDGHLAETYSTRELAALRRRAKREPRFADPVIHVLAPDGKETCTVRYGWSPAVSPDGRAVAYQHQKRPITGLRALAETLAGDDIRIHDCSTGAGVVIAEPKTGYFGRPSFLPDGKHLVFSHEDAVSGAYGGPVGIGVAPRAPGAATVLVAPRRPRCRPAAV
jgi:hypothetical protein